jgi:hypothetical protein
MEEMDLENEQFITTKSRIFVLASNTLICLGEAGMWASDWTLCQVEIL